MCIYIYTYVYIYARTIWTYTWVVTEKLCVRSPWNDITPTFHSCQWAFPLFVPFRPGETVVYLFFTRYWYSSLAPFPLFAFLNLRFCRGVIFTITAHQQQYQLFALSSSRLPSLLLFNSLSLLLFHSFFWPSSYYIFVFYIFFWEIVTGLVSNRMRRLLYPRRYSVSVRSYQPQPRAHTARWLKGMTRRIPDNGRWKFVTTKEYPIDSAGFTSCVKAYRAETAVPTQAHAHSFSRHTLANTGLSVSFWLTYSLARPSWVKGGR